MNIGTLRKVESIDESIAAKAIMDAIETVKAVKPQDRSEKDRACAVTITQLELALAYFVAFVGIGPLPTVPSEDMTKPKVPPPTRPDISRG